MKKEIIEAHLTIIDNKPIVMVKGREGYTTPDTLISFLKNGISSKEIKACTPKSEKGYTTYKFKVYNEEGNLNNYFVVKVKHSERYLHKSTIEKIKEVTYVSNLITKVNVNRFIAGIAVGAIILSVTAPTLTKGLKKLNQQDYGHDQQRYQKYSYSVSEPITEEQKQQAEKDYYANLRERILAGDKEAEQEYLNYIAERHLKNQANSSKSR